MSFSEIKNERVFKLEDLKEKSERVFKKFLAIKRSFALKILRILSYQHVDMNYSNQKNLVAKSHCKLSQSFVHAAVW